MAIIFDKAISENKLLMAINHNVAMFHSNNVLLPVNAQVIAPSFFDVVLYPNQNGRFRFDFKDYISAILNSDNFKDDMNVALDTLDPTSFFYYWQPKIYLNSDIEFRVNFADNSFETVTKNLKWLSAYLQVDEWQKTYPITDISHFFVLTPQVRGVIPRIKFWIGYPFDFTIYTPNTDDLEIQNKTTNTTLAVGGETILRVVVSDGVTLLTQLVNNIGDNKLDIVSEVNELSTASVIIERIRTKCKAKHYLKWINRFGGWNYWLFDQGRKAITPKGIGELNNDFNNLEDTLSQTMNIGVTSKKSIFVNDDVSEVDMLMLGDLFESPKIYLFTGEPETVNNYNNWIEVGIKEKNVRIEDPKINFLNVEIEIELPARTTRTL